MSKNNVVGEEGLEPPVSLRERIYSPRGYQLPVTLPFLKFLKKLIYEVQTVRTFI